MAIGEVIRDARNALGLTQAELASELYVTRQAVSRWENGESSPSIDMAKLIARTLEIPITQLLELPDAPVCQSCGMIMTPADYGFEHDGTQSEDYCSWCYNDGGFTKPARSLDEQIEISAQGLVDNLGYSLEEAVSLMGVALPTLLRWQTIQENEERYGAEARARYGDDVIDAANRKLLSMDIPAYRSLEDLGDQILEKLARLLPSADPASEEAQRLCCMHARWIQGHWPYGLYTPEAHLNLARGYLEDARFMKYYDDACGKGATRFLVNALEIFLA